MKNHFHFSTSSYHILSRSAGAFFMVLAVACIRGAFAYAICDGAALGVQLFHGGWLTSDFLSVCQIFYLSNVC